MALRLAFGNLASRVTSRLLHVNVNVAKCFQTNFNTLRNASFLAVQNVRCDLLSPVSPMLTFVSGLKVKGRLRRRCKDCYFVMRQNRMYIMCKTHPRHKQVAMKSPEKMSWILTHATQGKIRPW